MAEPLKGILSGESCILKIFKQTCYLSPRIKTVLHFNVNRDRISWYCHIPGSLFLSWMFIMSVQHVLTLVPDLIGSLLRPAESNRKPGAAGKQQGPLGPCLHQRTAGLSEWGLTYFHSVLHFTEHIIIPIWQWKPLREATLPKSRSYLMSELKDGSSKPAHFAFNKISQWFQKRWVERYDIKE